jgi:hypothetical protein
MEGVDIDCATYESLPLRYKCAIEFENTRRGQFIKCTSILLLLSLYGFGAE